VRCTHELASDPPSSYLNGSRDPATRQRATRACSTHPPPRLETARHDDQIEPSPKAGFQWTRARDGGASPGLATYEIYPDSESTGSRAVRTWQLTTHRQQAPPPLVYSTSRPSNAPSRREQHVLRARRGYLIRVVGEKGRSDARTSGNPYSLAPALGAASARRKLAWSVATPFQWPWTYRSLRLADLDHRQAGLLITRSASSTRAWITYAP
jgi:hypothetical protein